ncbi:MAG: flippase [Candidatus Shapirobacteria bacterium]|nr:flippase [Candidatus Shapirobacteria bacterium]MDD4410499.1 flippase [Candidatus Shapirobacteria bacterium]
MSNKRILIKNVFWLGAVEFFSKILLFFVIVGLVRYWGAEEFGAFNLAFAYVAIFMILADFGLSTITTREVAKHKDLSEKYLGNLIGLKLFLSVIIGIFFAASFLFVNKPVSIQLLVATLIYSLIQGFQTLFISIFQAWERMEMVFFNRMVFYVGVLISALLVIKFHGSATNLVFGYMMATILAIILGVWQSHLLKIKVKIIFDFKFWRELIKEALPLLGMTAAMVIYANNDTLLIGRYFNNNQVGFYQTAFKILFAFQSINVINYVVFPRLTVLFHEDKEDTAKKLIKIVVGLSIVGLIPLAAIITWQRELIMKLIYGQSFVVSAGVMSLLIWSGVINYFRVFVGNLLVIKKKQNMVFWSILIGTLVNLTINYFLIPKFGFVQAGWSLIISELVILVVMAVSLRKTSEL